MSLPIIFIHKGDSFYLKYAFENAKKFNPNSRIILLGENVTKYPYFVEYFKISDYSISANKFRKIYKHMSNNNEEIERFCFERWFILDEFLKKNKIKKCLTLDSDVLLFVDVTKDSKKFKNFKFTLVDQTCGSIMFINDSFEISKLTDFISKLYLDKKLSKIFILFWKNYKFKNSFGGVSDMLALNEYSKKNSKKIGETSKIINGEIYDSSIGVKQGMIMKNKIKKIIFVSKLPYSILEKTNLKVKLCCIHFSGPTKFYMKYYSNGKITFLDEITIKLLIVLRDKYSVLLNDFQRKFLKKMLVKIGF